MSRRILLADDSVTIQKVIELTFMDDDYEVRAVGNGDEALALLSALRVDFVIADVHMPGANGYEVCRRSKEQHPEVPVLLLVGTFEPFDDAQARECGANAYLKKPFDSQELLSRVHDLLGASAAAAPAAQAPHPYAEPSAVPFAFGDAVAAAPQAFVESVAAVPHPFAAAAPAVAPYHFAEPAPPPPAAPPSGAAHAFAEPAPVAPYLPDPLPVAPPAGAPIPIEAAASWQEFELEAEPEMVPEPWHPQEDPPAAPAASAAPFSAPAGFEQPFALGNLDELPDVDGELPPLPAAPAPAAATPAAPSWQAASPLGSAEAAYDRATTEEPIRGFGMTASRATSAFQETEAPAPAPWELAPPAPPAGPVAPYAAGAALAAAGAAAAAVGSAGDSDSDGHAATHAAAAVPEPAPAAEPVAAAPDVAVPAAPAAAAAAPAAGDTGGANRTAAAGISDADVERIARRVVELMGEKVVRDVAWEVIPDLAEVVIKDRLRELESQIE